MKKNEKKEVRFFIRVGEAQHRTLKIAAALQGVNMNRLVDQLIETTLNDQVSKAQIAAQQE